MLSMHGESLALFRTHHMGPDPWMFNLVGHQPLELVHRSEGGLAFKAQWVREVRSHLEDTAAAINFISLHWAFVQGTPVPRRFDIGILSALFHLHDQAQSVCLLAVMVMGELLAFINQWRITLGPSWASTISYAVQSFLDQLHLAMLPMWGGIFDAEDSTHSFFIWQAVRLGYPVFLLNTDSAMACKQLLRVNHDLNKMYHTAIATSESLLTEDKIPDIQFFLKELRASDCNLQLVECRQSMAIPLFLPLLMMVYLQIHEWRMILLPKHL